MPPADISVTAQPIQQTPLANPLIDQSGEDAIYVGVGVIAVAIVLMVGLLSHRLIHAIIFALMLSAVIALIIIAI
ncbi:MAG TPA: hypothetical protein V6C64_08415 [Microcoleaceae cyanobacterium]|jgi:hypothetical protein